MVDKFLYNYIDDVYFFIYQKSFLGDSFDK